MATKYGGYYTGAGYNAFRAVLVYETTSTSETSYTLKASVKCQMGDGHDSGSNFSATATVNGSSSSGTGSGYYSAGTTSGVIASKSVAISRIHTAQTITLKGLVKSTYTWSGKTSSASATITVPAKPSYTIAFNANGGSGAPSSQTKWYGETLKLSTTKPTRSGYDFLGWATSSGATSASYAAGGNYTANSGTTLYAVWKRSYIAPSITAASVYRSNDLGVADDEGTSCFVEVSWSVNTTLASGNQGDSLRVDWKLSTSTSWTTGTTVSLSGASGTTSTVVTPSGGFNTNSTYNVRVIVSDTSGQSGNTASITRTLSPSFFLMDALNGNVGRALTFGRGATSADNGKLVVGSNMRLVTELPAIVHPVVTYTGTSTTNTASATGWRLTYFNVVVGKKIGNPDAFYTNSNGVIKALVDCSLEISGVMRWQDNATGQLGFGIFIGGTEGGMDGSEVSVFNHFAPTASINKSVIFPPHLFHLTAGQFLTIGRYEVVGSIYTNGASYGKFTYMTIKVVG